MRLYERNGEDFDRVRRIRPLTPIGRSRPPATFRGRSVPWSGETTTNGLRAGDGTDGRWSLHHVHFQSQTLQNQASYGRHLEHVARNATI